MQKILPCLWFNNNAEEAVKFYTTLFKNSKILATSHYGKNQPMPEGTVLTIDFQIEGQEVQALNGGAEFKFNEAMSLVVNCDSQQEIDTYWDALTADGGDESVCGWLKDKYGLSWQIVPAALAGWMQSSDPARTQRVMDALLKMKKLDIKTLQSAYEHA
jgi:predicted 3-demethylubiquinone-9 3-methyltransferase (glyoxalase superfamily)